MTSLPSTVRRHMSNVADIQRPRSSFDLSYGHKTTFSQGVLTPVYLEEVIPGDTISLKASVVARLTPMVFPIMDNIRLRLFFFYVPTRLVWTHWVNFYGEIEDPNAEPIEYSVPQINVTEGTALKSTSIYGYCGLPVEVAPDAQNPLTFTALPFRCMYKVWNDHFRAQEVQPDLAFTLGDEDVAETAFKLSDLVINKPLDYFTMCLPSPQLGDPVTIGLAGTADVISSGEIPRFDSFVPGGISNAALQTINDTTTTGDLRINQTPASSEDLIFGNTTGLLTDLSQASGITINDFRIAFQLQALKELDIRAGHRYFERIHSLFGVVNPDSRLQRSEFLGSFHTKVNIAPVPNTADTDEVSGRVQGDLAAFGVAVNSSHGFSRSFPEWGYIIGFATISADITYQHGIAKMFSRRSIHDFYNPLFANVGEQVVANQEIYYALDGDNDKVFGYNPAWQEHRYHASMVSGLFNSRSKDSGGAANTLDSWHLAENYTSRPVLSSDFMKTNIPLDRIKGLTNSPDVIADFYFNVRAMRVLPSYAKPIQLDRRIG